MPCHINQRIIVLPALGLVNAVDHFDVAVCGIEINQLQIFTEPGSTVSGSRGGPRIGHPLVPQHACRNILPRY